MFYLWQYFVHMLCSFLSSLSDDTAFTTIGLYIHLKSVNLEITTYKVRSRDKKSESRDRKSESRDIKITNFVILRLFL